MVRVLATGTFDILHPGHVFYLEQARKLGDELCVIVARESMVMHKPKPLIPEGQRLKMVSVLRAVDHAVLGDEEDMFKPVLEIKPDIIALGYNQHFDEDKLRKELEKRGIRSEVIRIEDAADGAYYSTRTIIKRIRNGNTESSG